jgi:hypothetical protein
MNESTEQVAFHEAAHCIAALNLGVGVTSATIDPTRLREGALGEVLPARSQTTREALIFLMAGMVATKRRFGNAAGNGGDIARVQEITTKCGVTRDQLAALYQEACGIVDREWRAVEAVAGELLKHGTLTGRRVAAIRDCAVNAELHRMIDGWLAPVTSPRE